jgi:hypothetical protein
MGLAFERFVQKGRSFRPVIAIWKRGQIGFNRGAVKVCKIEQGYYVLFFYDSDEKKIGFRFTKDQDEEGAVRLKIYNTGAFASAKAFLDYYQVDHKITTKYELSHDKENDIFVIDLKKELSRKEDEK